MKHSRFRWIKTGILAVTGAASAFLSAPAATALEKAAPTAATSETATDATDANPALGPAIGDPAPHSLEALASNGARVSLSSITGARGVALFFVRSVDWCPYCKAQALDVNKRLDDFIEMGLNVAFVSYDSTEKQAAFAGENDFKPTLISDPDIDIINAFGLRNEKYAEGSRFYGIPHPAVFIINPEAEIVAKLYEADYLSNDKSYRNRPAVDVILERADLALADKTAAH
ncbi:MAG: peroxiredoxin family protein [Pseudomonadota bacterium]